MANYAICKETGLSYSIIDSHKCKGINTHIYKLEIDQDKLIKQVTRMSAKCTSQYLVAASLVWLDQNRLIIGKAKENRYTRSQIVEYLADNYARYQLIKLWQTIRHSKANMKASPMKINLVTALEKPASLYYLLESIGNQTLGEEDYAIFKANSYLTQKNKRIVKREKKEAHKKLGIIKGKLDPKSVAIRVRVNTSLIARELDKIAKQEKAIVLANPFVSYQKAADSLRDYLYLNSKVKARVIEIYKELYEKAVGYQVIPRDGIMDKSIAIMIRLLESEIPIVEEMEDF